MTNLASTGSTDSFSKLKNSRGEELHITKWIEIEQEHPKAVILYCHGIGDYISTEQHINGTFGHRSQYFNSKNIACYGIDFHGHGNSEGVRCSIVNFDHLVDEAELLLKTIEEAHPGIPVFVFGESMGGAVSLQLSLKVQQRIKGIILIAPMVKIHPDLYPPKFVVSTLKCLKSVIPRAAIVPGKSSDLIDKCFRDPEKAEMAKNDNKKYTGTHRIGTAVTMLEVTEKIQTDFPDYKCPMFVLHGKADEVTSPEFSELLVEKAGSTDKTIKIYDEMYHAMLSEQEWSDVCYPDILSWINARV